MAANSDQMHRQFRSSNVGPMMSKYIFPFNKKLTKLILTKFPVQNKRTPLWFFKKELEAAKSCPELAKLQPLKHLKVLEVWHNLDPETKRKFFYLSKTDEIRYKEEKLLRNAKLISLIAEHGNQIEKIIETLPDSKDSQDDESQSCNKKNNYELMLQAESTKNLYKDVIEHKDKSGNGMSSEDMMTDVPRSCRPILHRPRRPPASFVIFINENRDRINEAAKLQGIHPAKLASLEWQEKNQEDRAKYVEKYNKLLNEYLDACKKFKENHHDEYMDQLSREKKAYTKSVRRQLRKHDIVPLNVRNAFNFFLMSQKDGKISELSGIWREMPDEEKQEYQLMRQKDSERYSTEKDFYVYMNKYLDNLLNPRNAVKLMKEESGEE